MNKEHILGLFPLSTSCDDQGNLLIAKHSVPSLAEEYGTPLYVYDGKTIKDHISLIQSLLKEHYQGASALAYAAKAYISPKFASKLAQTKVELDVVSLNEMKLAIQNGFDPDLIHLHGNNKSIEELTFALENHIHAIVVDNGQELALLEKLAGDRGMRAPVWLRITPDLHVDTHAHIETSAIDSKFGFHIDNGDAELAIRQAAASRYINLLGLHCHLGSQLFNHEPYKAAIKRILTTASKCKYYPLEFSPGGGWGVPYTPSQSVADPTAWILAVTEAVQEFYLAKRMSPPRLIVESGRWIVAQAGVAIYKTGFQKVLPTGERILSIDGGLADNPRKALYNAEYIAWIANKMNDPHFAPYRVVGKYCETGDILIQSVKLPEPDYGDLLAVPVSGAYQLSMASNYNLSSRPAVLWLEEDKPAEILQRRENLLESGWWE